MEDCDQYKMQAEGPLARFVPEVSPPCKGSKDAADRSNEQKTVFGNAPAAGLSPPFIIAEYRKCNEIDDQEIKKYFCELAVGHNSRHYLRCSPIIGIARSPGKGTYQMSVFGLAQRFSNSLAMV